MEIVVIRTPINMVHGCFISIIYEVYKPTYDCAHPVPTWDRKYLGIWNNWGCCLHWEFDRFGRSSNTLTVGQELFDPSFVLISVPRWHMWHQCGVSQEEIINKDEVKKVQWSLHGTSFLFNSSCTTELSGVNRPLCWGIGGSQHCTELGLVADPCLKGSGGGLNPKKESDSKMEKRT